MVERKIRMLCDTCEHETVHVASENALEIDYKCTECGREKEVVKSFF
ncbi:hypothetical protein [Peribacillus kribbensis]|nr:hypothetical protein [Peribacillus kribbensis]